MTQWGRTCALKEVFSVLAYTVCFKLQNKFSFVAHRVIFTLFRSLALLFALRPDWLNELLWCSTAAAFSSFMLRHVHSKSDDVIHTKLSLSDPFFFFFGWQQIITLFFRDAVEKEGTAHDCVDLWPCKASLARSSSCSLSLSCTRSSVADSRFAEQPPWVSSRSLLNMSFICRSRWTSSWSWATSSRSNTVGGGRHKMILCNLAYAKEQFVNSVCGTVRRNEIKSEGRKICKKIKPERK